MKALIPLIFLAGCSSILTPEKAPKGSVDAQYDEQCLSQVAFVCTCYPDEEKPETIVLHGKEYVYAELCEVE
jgi:uncharacterized protein YceK